MGRVWITSETELWVLVMDRVWCGGKGRGPLSTEQLDTVESGKRGVSHLGITLTFGEGHLQCLAELHLRQRQDSQQVQVG